MMANSRISSHFPLTHDTNMAVSTANLIDAASDLRESARVEIVQLSGPIQIIIPVEDCTNRKHAYLEKTSDTLIFANNNTMIERSISSPIDESHGGDCDDSGRKFLAPPNSEMISPALPTTTKDAPVKKLDCNNPDDTMSPL